MSAPPQPYLEPQRHARQSFGWLFGGLLYVDGKLVEIMRYPTSNIQKSSDLRKKPTSLVLIVAPILLATFLSPQIGYWGHGLKLSLPLIVALNLIGLLCYKPRMIVHLILRSKYSLSVVIGLLFVFSGYIRYLVAPNNSWLQNYVLTALICILLYISIISIRTTFPEALNIIRFLILIIMAVSLGIGIPALYGDPGIARFTTSSKANEYLVLSSKGIGNYGSYTGAALAWPVIAQWLYNQRNPIKIAGWTALIVISVAIAISTFTMAGALLCLGVLAWIGLIITRQRSKHYQLLATAVVVVTIPFLPSLYESGLNSDVTGFSVSKATRLYEGTQTSGIWVGDETGRAIMFRDTMDSFFASPGFGLWGISRGSDFYIGGHSSLGDTLGLFGVFGILLWGGFLARSWVRNKPFSLTAGYAGGTISWILLLIGGVLNPTYYSSSALTLIWLFDDFVAIGANSLENGTGHEK